MLLNARRLLEQCVPFAHLDESAFAPAQDQSSAPRPLSLVRCAKGGRAAGERKPEVRRGAHMKAASCAISWTEVASTLMKRIVVPNSIWPRAQR